MAGDEVREEGRFQGMVLERLDTVVRGVSELNVKVGALTNVQGDHEYRIQVLERARKAAERDRRFFWGGVLALAAAAVAALRLILGR